MHVYSEMLALFAGRPYDVALANLSDLRSHLTNTCRQVSDSASGDSDSGGNGDSNSRADDRSQPGRGATGDSGGGDGRQNDGGDCGGGTEHFDEADVVRLFSELPEVGFGTV